MEAWFAPYVADGLHLGVVGVRRRDGHTRAAADLLGAVRQVPALADDHRPPRRDAAVRRLPRRIATTGSAAVPTQVNRLKRLPSEYLRNNFHVTTSGNFCPPAFACTLEVMGADRVMFSVDYPMDDNQTGAEFLAAYPDGRRHARKSQLRERRSALRRAHPRDARRLARQGEHLAVAGDGDLAVKVLADGVLPFGVRSGRSAHNGSGPHAWHWPRQPPRPTCSAEVCELFR